MSLPIFFYNKNYQHNVSVFFRDNNPATPKTLFLKKLQLLIILLDIFFLLLIFYQNLKPSQHQITISSPPTSPQKVTVTKHQPIVPQVEATSGETPTEIHNDQTMINHILQGVPEQAKPAAAKNLPFIITALRNENILNQNVLAYAVATIEHETAGTFEPIEEYNGRYHAWKFGYEGGLDYYGRGFIQLTHLRNYHMMGERIGLGEALVYNPNLALDTEIAAKILAAYFKDHGIADLATQGYFIDARTPINPDWNGRWIAYLTSKYL